MTTHADHHIWQDIYHANLDAGLMVYIKLTLRENGIVEIQYKEKQDEILVLAGCGSR